MVGDTLQAFTASFPGETNDETNKVEELCSLIEIGVHKTFPSQRDDIENRLINAARVMEAPFFSSACIVHDMLMEQVRSNEIQIVLDGLGGDELFAGYPWYVPLAVRDNLYRLRLREAMGHINQCESRSKAIWTAILPRRLPHQTKTLMRSLRGQPKDWYSSLLRSDLQPQVSPAVEGKNCLDQALKVDLLQHNVPRWLHMGDRISMANSVVCRSPFLDYRLVEFAFGLDNNLKIRNAETKHILREAKRAALPASIVNDQKKIQFSGPERYWLKGALKAFGLSLRDGNDVKLSQLLRADSMSSFIDKFFRSKRPNPTRMWRILSSEAFLRAYS